MQRDDERVERIREALRETELDAVACALPVNVLLLTGYWPVVGMAVALATREGRIGVLCPVDEEELARQGWADTARTFAAGSLEAIVSPPEAMRGPLGRLAAEMGIERGRVGYEAAGMFEPAPYAALHVFGARIAGLLGEAMPSASLAPADAMLARLRAVKTPGEIERIRTACRIAEQAFLEGSARLRPGLAETEAAGLFRAPLGARGVGFDGVQRADGFAWCMSGPNAAQASAAYQISRARRLAAGDLALVHCNSYADGFWTDITRTYCLEQADDRQMALYAAVFDARTAAMEAVRPGARAADVDRAAREELATRGFGPAFRHPTGHGVGFAAINHYARPCLHPKSSDVLETGMVFNVEPGLYFDGYGGLRHCDMVAVMENGAEMLTPFQGHPDDLLISPAPAGEERLAA